MPGPASSLTDPARLRALATTGLLDSPADPSFDRLTRLAAHVMRAPVALISLVDDRRQFFKSAAGLAEPWASRRETPLTHSLCQHVLAGGAPLVVTDTRENPVTQGSLAITELEVVAYLGVPLVTSEGHALGALCVTEPTPRTWTDEDVSILRELAELTITEVELRRAYELARTAETSGQRVQKDLEQQNSILQAVLTSMGDGVIVADERGRVVLTNPAADRLLGRSFDEVPPAGWTAHFGLFLPDGVTPYPPEQLPLARALRGERTDDVEVFVRSPTIPEGRWNSSSGRPLVDASGAARGGVCVVRDLTERKHAEQRLAEWAARLGELSFVDGLTGLSNRQGFLMLATHQLRIASRTRRALALFFLDLDGLKAINDDLGHEAGDRAIKETAALLHRTFRGSDILARLGGDEFVVLATEPDVEGVDRIRERLTANVAAVNAAEGRDYELAMSVGAAIYDPAAPETIEALLARADALMYREKRAHRASSRPPLEG